MSAGGVRRRYLFTALVAVGCAASVWTWGSATYAPGVATTIGSVPDEAMSFFTQLTRRDGRLVVLWYDPLQRVADIREYTPQPDGGYRSTAGQYVYAPSGSLGQLVAATIDPADNTKLVLTWWDDLRGVLVLHVYARQGS